MPLPPLRPAIVVALVLATVARVAAIETAGGPRLDPDVAWRIAAVRLRGIHHLRRAEVRKVMATRTRPFYAVWQKRPRFDAEVLRDDVAKVTAFYRASGYYQASVDTRVEPDREHATVEVIVDVEEGPPVRVREITIEREEVSATAPSEATLRSVLPLTAGDVFSESAYDEGRARLLARARRETFARTTVRKHAVVNVAAGTADVAYRIRFGPRCRFGAVSVEGLERIEPAVVRREITFEPGEPFSPAKIEATRKNLQQLRLFRTVVLAEDDSRDPVVDVTVRVTEAPHREVRLGVGYDTEEEIRGLAAWRSYDFLGGARQLGFTARASFLRRSIAADFIQPHEPFHTTRIRLLGTFEDDEEDTFSLTRARFFPRVEWQPSPSLVGFAAYRIEHDHLTHVDNAVSRALAPEATPTRAVLSGLSFGLDWNHVDDLLNPTRGWEMNGVVDPVGGVLGGDASFVRLLGTLRVYHPLPLGLLGAGRVRMGWEDPVAGSHDIPVWERFYAGGIDSVRGYGRWRVGPLAQDDPIGGRSLLETSAELRYPITEQIALVTFLDAGQVARKSWQFPINDMQLGTGFGVHYLTPVGPIRLEIGFPLDPRGKDRAWQLHVSVGQVF